MAEHHLRACPHMVTDVLPRMAPPGGSRSVTALLLQVQRAQGVLAWSQPALCGWCVAPDNSVAGRLWLIAACRPYQKRIIAGRRPVKNAGCKPRTLCAPYQVANRLLRTLWPTGGVALKGLAMALRIFLDPKAALKANVVSLPERR